MRPGLSAGEPACSVSGEGGAVTSRPPGWLLVKSWGGAGVPGASGSGRPCETAMSWSSVMASSSSLLYLPAVGAVDTVRVAVRTGAMPNRLRVWNAYLLAWVVGML